MTEQGGQDAVTSHKEENPGKIAKDAEDRCKIQTKLSALIDPLKPESHPDCLVNIVKGQIASDKVNVAEALVIGNKHMQEFEST